MNFLLPSTITSAMIGSGTNIPAVDAAAGEVAWTASGSYVVGDERVSADAIYSCVKAHAATSSSKPPSQDAINWLYKQPTNLMSPFDEYIYTKTVKAGEIIIQVAPGFFDGFVLHGAECDELQYTLRDEHGGEIIATDRREMWEQAFGEWEYLFGNLRKENKFTKSKLPMRPAAELEVALRRFDSTVNAELGLLSIGQWRSLLGAGTNVSGVQYGAEVTQKSYSYFKENADGTYTRKRGRQAKLITATIIIDRNKSDEAEDLLRKIRDIPVAVDLGDLPNYGYISTFGFVTGSIVPESWSTCRVNIKVDGNV